MKTGRSVSWDTTKGLELWNDGWLAAAIAAEVSVGAKRPVARTAIISFAHRHGWPPRFKMTPVEPREIVHRPVNFGKAQKRCPDCWAIHSTTEAHECKGRATTPRFADGWVA